jgi:hypothetical protein
MSRKTALQADLKRIGYQLGGAHLTRQARNATFNTFARTMRELGYGIHAASQIGGRHLQAFADQRVTLGISPRTLANEMSHLRSTLAQVGKQCLAHNPAYSNEALDIGRGGRIGTKQPLSDAAIREFQQRMAGLGRPGIGAILELQREFGLRANEAVRAGQHSTLARWQRELERHGYVRVIEGTKGGRPRDVHPVDLERVQAVLQRARTVLETTGQHYLVTGADGHPSTDLRAALGSYRNLCHRAGIQSHGARYAFAQERLQAYRNQSYSEREARAATSLDLGHGDGRGRYIASVYARDC